MVNLIILSIFGLFIFVPTLWTGILVVLNIYIKYKERQKYRRDKERGLNPSPWSKR